jgi:AbrB family looped-hinge helix DNA binding protein
MDDTAVTNNTPQQQCRVHISSNGRLNLPAQFRKAAKLKDGDELLLSLKDNIIQIQPLDQVIAEVQEIVAKYFSGDALMDELLSMRSSEVANESHKIEKSNI